MSRLPVALGALAFAGACATQPEPVAEPTPATTGHPGCDVPGVAVFDLDGQPLCTGPSTTTTRPVPPSTTTSTTAPTTTTVIPLVLSNPDELAMLLDSVAVDVIGSYADPDDYAGFIDEVHAAETEFHDAVVDGRTAYTVDPWAIAETYLTERHPTEAAGTAYADHADCLIDIMTTSVTDPAGPDCEGLP